MNVRVIRCFALLVLLAFFSDGVACNSAFGKPRGGGSKNNKPQPPTFSSVTLWGTIESIQPNGSGLKIMAGTSAKSKSQKEWLVKPQSTTDVTVEGTATLDYLHKKPVVEFSAEVINNDHINGKLKELTIVDSTTGHPSGPGAKKKDHSADAGVGGRIEAPKDDEAASGAGKAAKAGKEHAEAAIVAPGTKSTIVGKIVMQDDKKLTIACKGRKITVELADIPTINVRLSDPKLVKSGAKIEVSGNGAQSKEGNMVEAKTITVTLTEPLGGLKTASPSSAKKIADK